MENIRKILSEINTKLENTYGEIFWHLDINHQENNVAYLLGYNEANDFVEVSIFENTYEVRFFLNGDWVEQVDF
jgi:hypothetical protein